MRQWLYDNRFCRCCKGIAAVEFALISPVLLLLIMGTADTGLSLIRKLQLQSAAQGGAQYAAIHGFSVSSISGIVTGTSPLILANPQPQQFCGCASATGLAEVACSVTCANNQTAGTYVRISASSVYKPFFPYPFVGDAVDLVSQATLRLK
jgi:hypothetical protein